MWWLALAVVLGACTFERSAAVPGDVDAPALEDAPPIDMPPAAACRTTYPMEFQGHRYRLTDRGYTWMDAQQFCASEGGHLVKIETREEDDFIANQVDGNEFPFVWFGLQDPAKDNNLSWTDGTPLGGFSHWDTFQPSGAIGNDCGDKRTTDTRGEWFMFACTDVKRGYCECDG